MYFGIYKTLYYKVILCLYRKLNYKRTRCVRKWVGLDLGLNFNFSPILISLKQDLKSNYFKKETPLYCSIFRNP
jgi:hypothetical protein